MRTRSLLALAASLALAACGTTGAPDEVVYGVAVYTQPSPGVDFGPLATYYVEPMVRVRKDGQDQTDVPMPASVMAAIDDQMQAAGFTPGASDSAEVGLKLAYVTNSVDYYYTGGWCDIYYGWYGCYYPPVYAGSYRYGTALLQMYEQIPPIAGQPFPALWFSSMYGVVDDFSPTADTTRLVNAINRAFEQSPYLQHAP
jgi:hypothetical protein